MSKIIFHDFGSGTSEEGVEPVENDKSNRIVEFSVELDQFDPYAPLEVREIEIFLEQLPKIQSAIQHSGFSRDTLASNKRVVSKMTTEEVCRIITYSNLNEWMMKPSYFRALLEATQSSGIYSLTRMMEGLLDIPDSLLEGIRFPPTDSED